MWCGWSVMAEYGAGATRTMANVFFVGTNWDNFVAENNVDVSLQKNGAIPAFSKPLGQPQKALG